MVRCFMVEPVYGAPQSPAQIREYKYEYWTPGDPPIERWRRPDTGEEKEHPHYFGPGAMFYAVYMTKGWCWDNETEPHLLVVCPNGRTWDIDSRCSNCGLPEDHVHRCWIRSGIPPDVTVNKGGLNAQTCVAGAGSIQAGDYHGFLTNGEFNP